MKKILLIIFGLFVLIVIFGATVGDTPEARERIAQKDKIDRCWENQGKKSLDPSTARFVAGVCEKLENDFMTQWGRRP